MPPQIGGVDHGFLSIYDPNAPVEARRHESFPTMHRVLGEDRPYVQLLTWFLSHLGFYLSYLLSIQQTIHMDATSGGRTWALTGALCNTERCASLLLPRRRGGGKDKGGRALLKIKGLPASRLVCLVN